MTNRASLHRATIVATLAFAASALFSGCLTTTTDGGMAAPVSYDTVHMRLDFNRQVRTVVIQLDEHAAPQTVANFKKLLRERYYDGLAFHRAIPSYLVQTGDPLTRDDANRDSWGTGGPGYTIPSETVKRHKRGTVAMARLGNAVNTSKASNGSQFFICLDDIPSLDGEYSAFGDVIQGIEILDEMAALPTDTNDIPKRRVEIVSMAITRPDAVVAKPRESDRPKRKDTQPDSEKGIFERSIERFW